MDRREFSAALVASSVAAGLRRLRVQMKHHGAIELRRPVRFRWASRRQVDRENEGAGTYRRRDFANADRLLRVGLKGTTDPMKDQRTLDFVESAGESAHFVTSVCTGSLPLGAAGLLKGYDATSHWYVRICCP